MVDSNTVVAGGSFFDGGGDTIRDTGDCPTHIYRVGLLVTGYLPGEYSYTASNNQTTSPVTSPVFRVEGKVKNEQMMSDQSNFMTSSILYLNTNNIILLCLL